MKEVSIAITTAIIIGITAIIAEDYGYERGRIAKMQEIQTKLMSKKENES